MEPKRSGLFSFLLAVGWLEAVIGLISPIAIFLLSAGFVDFPLWSTLVPKDSMPNFLIVSRIIFAIAQIIILAGLMKWKKWSPVAMIIFLIVSLVWPFVVQLIMMNSNLDSMASVGFGSVWPLVFLFLWIYVIRKHWLMFR